MFDKLADLDRQIEELRRASSQEPLTPVLQRMRELEGRLKKLDEALRAEAAGLRRGEERLGGLQEELRRLDAVLPLPPGPEPLPDLSASSGDWELRSWPGARDRQAEEQAAAPAPATELPPQPSSAAPAPPAPPSSIFGASLKDIILKGEASPQAPADPLGNAVDRLREAQGELIDDGGKRDNK